VRHKVTPTLWRQEDTQRGPQSGPQVGGNLHSRDALQGPEREGQGILEEADTPPQTEETTDSFCAGAVGLPATF
jgi:hypothetical protein